MNEKALEKMKKLLEEKNGKSDTKKKIIPEKVIGTGQKSKSKLKSGGSNNKV